MILNLHFMFLIENFMTLQIDMILIDAFLLMLLAVDLFIFKQSNFFSTDINPYGFIKYL